MIDRPLYVGVDVGRSTRAALVDETGRIIAYRRETTHFESGRNVVDDLIRCVRSAIEAAEGQGNVVAVGVGLPGLVEHQTNRVVMLPNLADVSDIDAFDELRAATGLPVVFDNDANAAVYGEWRCGAATGSNDVICVTLGTGIGAGIIQGGVIQRGAHGFAGEFGHLKVTVEGLECSCGSQGCLETIASGPNIVRRTRERLFSDASFSLGPLAAKMRGRLGCEEVVEAAAHGDRLARAIIYETGIYLGMTVANVVNLLNLDLVVLGGPVMRENTALLDAAVEEAGRRAFTPSFATCRIVAALLGDDAGVIGSAMMARDATRAEHGSNAAASD